MKKKWLIGVAGIAAVVTLMAVGPDDAIPQLRVTLANLGLRVDKLESAAGIAPAAGQAAPSDAPIRSMVLVSVHLAQPNGDNDDEIADLKQQCSALMDTVNNNADAAASDLGAAVDNRAGTVWVRGGVVGWAGGYGGAAIADKQTENRYATLHAIKKAQLDALQDAAKTPHQIIVGHTDKAIIVLETKIDLSTSLNNIAVGNLVSWEGTRLNVDLTSETWRIDSIKKGGSK